MDDLISRQTAIKIIKNYCENGCDIAADNWCPSCQREQFIKLLEALPFAQPYDYSDGYADGYKQGQKDAQPEIVMCGQCKYAEVADAKDNQDGYTCQFHRGSIWFSGSYCSWAERKEGEADAAD